MYTNTPRVLTPYVSKPPSLPIQERSLVELTFEAAVNPFGDWRREFASNTVNWLPQDLVRTPVRQGSQAVRVEIQYAQPDAYGAARSEITRRSVDFDEWWYGFSIYIPSNFQVDPVSEIVAQWHDFPDLDAGEPWKTVPLALKLEDGHWAVYRRWDADRVTGRSLNDCDGYEVGVDLGPYQLGAWTDWVVRVRWDWDSDGYLEMWRNGQKVMERTGGNTYNDAIGPYFKFGIYKEAWPGMGTGAASTPTRVLFFDEIRQARADAGAYAAVAPRGARPP